MPITDNKSIYEIYNKHYDRYLEEGYAEEIAQHNAIIDTANECEIDSIAKVENVVEEYYEYDNSDWILERQELEDFAGDADQRQWEDDCYETF